MKKIESLKIPQVSIKAKHFGFLILSILLLIFILPLQTLAQGGLLITPRRVVFEGKHKTQQLNLANTGSDTASYVVSFVQYRMNEDGSFDQITEPDSGQFFADKNLRLFPRSVTLAPKEAQLVKLQLRNYRQLNDGEYRSHIYFRTVNNTTALGLDELDKDTTSLSVRLIPVFGISIPVIIRKGESTTQLSLSGLSVEMLNDTTPVLNVTFNRTGNMSVYGDIEVDYILGDETTQVGLARGLAVYTPKEIRHFKLNLNNKFDYTKGKLKVVYKTNNDLKPVALAEEELILH